MANRPETPLMHTDGLILVPLDGSKLAENAVPPALQLARALGSRLRVVHAAEDIPDGDLQEATAVFQRYVTDLVRRSGAEISSEDVLFVRGRAAGAILDTARDAQLIVIATHGRSGFHATFIGSVADKVVRGSTVPVLAITGADSPAELGEGPVLVALDGGEGGERSLAVARRVASALERKVVLLRAYTDLVPVTPEFAYLPPDLDNSLQEAARTYLEGVALADEHASVYQGVATDSIVAAADDFGAALVVMASSGKSLAKRVALGSTTDRVLHTIRRPLLIVPPEEED